MHIGNIRKSNKTVSIKHTNGPRHLVTKFPDSKWLKDKV